MSADLAIVYAALILQDENLDITHDKLQTLVKNAGISDIDPIWFKQYANALAGQNLSDLLFNVGSPAAGAAAGAGAATGAAAGAAEEAKEEEKKEEAKEESDEDMGFGLFD